MSPEESVTESQAESDDNSEEEQEATQKKKKIVVRPLSWRNQRFNEYIPRIQNPIQCCWLIGLYSYVSVIKVEMLRGRNSCNIRDSITEIQHFLKCEPDLLNLFLDLQKLCSYYKVINL